MLSKLETDDLHPIARALVNLKREFETDSDVLSFLMDFLLRASTPPQSRIATPESSRGPSPVRVSGPASGSLSVLARRRCSLPGIESPRPGAEQGGFAAAQSLANRLRFQRTLLNNEVWPMLSSSSSREQSATERIRVWIHSPSFLRALESPGILEQPFALQLFYCYFLTLAHMVGSPAILSPLNAIGALPRTPNSNKETPTQSSFSSFPATNHSPKEALPTLPPTGMSALRTRRAMSMKEAGRPLLRQATLHPASLSAIVRSNEPSISACDRYVRRRHFSVPNIFMERPVHSPKQGDTGDTSLAYMHQAFHVFRSKRAALQNKAMASLGAIAAHLTVSPSAPNSPLAYVFESVPRVVDYPNSPSADYKSPGSRVSAQPYNNSHRSSHRRPGLLNCYCCRGARVLKRKLWYHYVTFNNVTNPCIDDIDSEPLPSLPELPDLVVSVPASDGPQIAAPVLSSVVRPATPSASLQSGSMLSCSSDYPAAASSGPSSIITT